MSENLDQIAARFEGRQEPHIYICRSAKKYVFILVDRRAYGQTDDCQSTTEEEPTPSKLVTYESMGMDVAKLSDLVAQDYFGNYKIVSALAQKYGFKYFFFVPPSDRTGQQTSNTRRARNET